MQILQCRLEEMMPYPFSYAAALTRAAKSGVNFAVRFRNLQKITMNGFIISTNVAELIVDMFPRLSELNMTDCFISKGAMDVFQDVITYICIWNDHLLWFYGQILQDFTLTTLTLNGSECTLDAISRIPKLNRLNLTKKSLELNADNQDDQLLLNWFQKIQHLYVDTVASSASFRLLMKNCSNLKHFAINYCHKLFADDATFFEFCNWFGERVFDHFGCRKIGRKHLSKLGIMYRLEMFELDKI